MWKTPLNIQMKNVSFQLLEVSLATELTMFYLENKTHALVDIMHRTMFTDYSKLAHFSYLHFSQSYTDRHQRGSYRRCRRGSKLFKTRLQSGQAQWACRCDRIHARQTVNITQQNNNTSIFEPYHQHIFNIYSNLCVMVRVCSVVIVLDFHPANLARIPLTITRRAKKVPPKEFS